MSFDLPPQRKLTLNKMALGVLQPRTGQTIGVRTLVFLYSYLYGFTSEFCSTQANPRNSLRLTHYRHNETKKLSDVTLLTQEDKTIEERWRETGGKYLQNEIK